MTSKNLAPVFLVLLALTGCPKEMPTSGGTVTKTDASSAATPTGATISIASINPDPSQPLRAGAKVKIRVEADYVLPSQGGMVGLVIQGADNKPLESSLKPASGGSGRFSTEVEFVVPNAKQLTVHVPLYVKGEMKSSNVALKHYQIAGK
jgi:hypothetical protein